MADTGSDRSPYVVPSKAAVAAFFGVAEQTVGVWIGRGVPRRQTGTKRHEYDLSEIAKWYIATRKEAKPKDDVKGEALERWRAAKAQREELFLQRDRGELIHRDEVRRQLASMAAVMRAAAEKSRARYGADAEQIYLDALNEIEAAE